MLLQLVVAFLCLTSNVQRVGAFAPARTGSTASTACITGVSTTQLNEHVNVNNKQIQRRAVLSNLFFLGITASTAAPAHSTLMDKSIPQTKTFKVGEKLTTAEAKQRFVSAMTEVDELITNYDTISKNGGDAVRRYLGTVGVEKSMYGITKVVKDLREEADDIVEFTEAANEFEAYLYQAEGAAYQSLFVEHSSAKGTPESFLATAKKDVLSMRKYMGELAQQLSL